MKRTIVAVVVTALTVAAAASAAAHFTNGGQPVCTDVGLQLNCTAEVAGLGNETVDATVDAQGTAVGVTCTSPGGNTAPGQNPALPVNPSGSLDRCDDERTDRHAAAGGLPEQELANIDLRRDLQQLHADDQPGRHRPVHMQRQLQRRQQQRRHKHANLLEPAAKANDYEGGASQAAAPLRDSWCSSKRA